MSTSRSDYPNQINNVIGFPYIFRGALGYSSFPQSMRRWNCCRSRHCEPRQTAGTDVVNAAYHVNNLTFGPEYFIPKPVDPRLITEVSMAVAKAAMQSGVARKQIETGMLTNCVLRELMGYESKLTRQLYETARQNPQRVVFAEGGHPNMLKAAVEAKAEGICHPVLLGNDEKMRSWPKRTWFEHRRYWDCEFATRPWNGAPRTLRSHISRSALAKVLPTMKLTIRCLSETISVWWWWKRVMPMLW